MKIDYDFLKKLRETKPVVHNITNYVSAQNTANILLAIGAAPLMAHAEQELKDINQIDDALVLNIGTLDEVMIDAMTKAQTLANDKKIPVILDPVGAGASAYRTQTALAILERGINILRGNASEIMALANGGIANKGVESTMESISAEDAARSLSKKYSCIIVVSGATDIIIQGEQKFYIEKQAFTFLTKITGMGCSVTSVIGAFAATISDHFAAACHAMTVFAIASEKALYCSKGPGDFFTKFQDSLYQIDNNDFKLVQTVTENKIRILPFKQTIPAYLLTAQKLTRKLVDFIKAFLKLIITRRQQSILADKTTSGTSIPTMGKASVFNIENIDYSLYLIADLDYFNNDPEKLLSIVREALNAKPGVTCVQLRAKTASDTLTIKTGRALLNLLRPLGIPLIINDSLTVTQILDANGIHIGQSDAEVSEIRKQLGPEKIIGLSISNVKEAIDCREAEVNYFGVGPVLPTLTKKDATTSCGYDGLNQIRTILTKPIVAIGGINVENLTEVKRCQVEGIAVISAVLGADKPEAAAEALATVASIKKQKRTPTDNPLLILDSKKTTTTNIITPIPPVIAWTIAGSDSGGGAGIQADLATFYDLGVHPCTVITAITAQNSLEVASWQAVSNEMLLAQLQVLKNDLFPAAIKIGMLGSLEVMETVKNFLVELSCQAIVLDPVMMSTSGNSLCDSEAKDYFIKNIIPLAFVLTPNLKEVETILGFFPHNELEIIHAANQLLNLGASSVIIKGGHGTGKWSQDYCTDGKTSFWLSTIRHLHHNNHGSGCSFASAITANLALGHNWQNALVSAKMYVSKAIRTAIILGKGPGAVRHGLASSTYSITDMPLISSTSDIKSNQL